jgi:Fur family ferric uptake transcriptional regulator
MCQRCNYAELIAEQGLEPLPNRVRVLEVIGGRSSPPSARDITAALRRTGNINRVTVYRILDLLADKGLVEPMRSAGRSLTYGLAPNKNHPAHPHFHCRSCGIVTCLQPGSLKVDLESIRGAFAGEIQGVEVRVNGICRDCLKG